MKFFTIIQCKVEHLNTVRLPFLNHELVAFIFSLPANFKIRKGWNKWIMRQSLGEELPSEIAWRKDKIGYEPPQKDWLNSEQITKMLNDSQQFLVMSGILNKKILEKNAIASNSDYYWRYLMANQLLACDTKDIKYNSTSQTAEGEK